MPQRQIVVQHGGKLGKACTNGRIITKGTLEGQPLARVRLKGDVLIKQGVQRFGLLVCSRSLDKAKEAASLRRKLAR